MFSFRSAVACANIFITTGAAVVIGTPSARINTAATKGTVTYPFGDAINGQFQATATLAS